MVFVCVAFVGKCWDVAIFVANGFVYIRVLAVQVCARVQRAQELLNITAGTQSISPFYWAIAP